MEIVNVIGYEGLYAVTDEGKIYGLKRGGEIKPNAGGTGGYLQVTLKKNDVAHTFAVHRLVYRSFHKGTASYDEDKLVIDHIDGNKLNNNLSNLRKLTTRENTTRGKTRQYARGVHFFKHLNKFGAEIQIEGVRYNLGCTFLTAEEASEAYQKALKDWEENGVKPTKRDRSVKLCKGCRETKPIGEFYHVKSHGYSYLCKECMKAYSKAYRAKKKKKIINLIGGNRNESIRKL